MRHNDVARFDEWSRGYERSIAQRLFFDRVHGRLLAFLRARVPAPRDALDVGCGTGRLLRALRRAWPETRCLGVDPAPGMVAVARGLAPDMRFVVAGAEALPLADASVDLVLSTLSFHHWRDRGAGVREIARVLRPGGHFALVDVAGLRWLAWLAANDPYLGAAERDALFRASGLAVVEQRGLWTRFLLATLARRP